MTICVFTSPNFMKISKYIYIHYCHKEILYIYMYIYIYIQSTVLSAMIPVMAPLARLLNLKCCQTIYLGILC